MCSVIEWNPSLIDEGFLLTSKHREEILINVRNLINDYCNDSFSSKEIDLICGYWVEVFTENIFIAWKEILKGYVPNNELGEVPIIMSLSDSKNDLNNFNWHEHIKLVVFNIMSDRNVSNDNFAVNNNQLDTKKKNILKFRNIGFKLKKEILKPSRNTKVLFFCPDFRCTNIEKFQFFRKYKDSISILQENVFKLASYPIDFEWRLRKSSEYIYDQSFLSLVLILLPLYLPVEILESLNFNQERFLKLDLNAPKVVFTAGGLVQSPKLGIMMRIWKKNGTKLVIQQHGGGYGLDKHMTLEEYEKRNSDYFCTWGKRKSTSNSIYLSPANPKFLWKNFNYKKRNILFICNDVPSYMRRLEYSPSGEANKRMHLNVEYFLRNVNSKNNLLIRDYFHLSKWNKFKNKENNFLKNFNFDCEKNIYLSYSKAKITIHHLLTTTWLETLGMNIPTICFYDKNIQIFNEDAQEALNLLKENKVLHENVEDAVNFLNDVEKSYLDWWFSKKVQKARFNFSQKFCFFERNWSLSWEKFFLSIL